MIIFCNIKNYLHFYYAAFLIFLFLLFAKKSKRKLNINSIFLLGYGEFKKQQTKIYRSSKK